MLIFETENINCPSCGENKGVHWATENGYTAVKCIHCGLIYVNPRPSLALISEAVKTGMHREVGNGKSVIGRRVRSKVGYYKSVLTSMFNDVWDKSKPVSWLDVGAGYGEFVEAVSALALRGSKIEGLVPMKSKVQNARRRGLNIRDAYLSDIEDRFDFLSSINVFSHIPDFREFLKDVKMVLKPQGEFFIETGNIGDLHGPSDVPSELNLPDHLVFAGEQHILNYLREAGFSIVSIEKKRKDGFVNFGKNLIKKFIGRRVTLAVPYTSKYRRIFIRAKLSHSSNYNTEGTGS